VYYIVERTPAYPGADDVGNDQSVL